MYTLIVLGLIPGTNIQISFKLWLIVVTALAFVVVLVFRIRNQVRKGQRSNDLHSRITLFASQLHLRG